MSRSEGQVQNDVEQKNIDKQMRDVPSTIGIDISDIDYSIDVIHDCGRHRSQRDLDVKFTDTIGDLHPNARLMHISFNIKKLNPHIESLINCITKWLAPCQIDLLQIISVGNAEYVMQFIENFSFFKLKKIKLMFNNCSHKEFMESFIEQFKEKYPEIFADLYMHGT